MAYTATNQLTSKPPRQLLLWLCGVLLVALTMSRHWVICTHDDGDAHLEINHVQGGHDGHDGCDCDHLGDDGRDCDGDHPEHPHDTCRHIDLLVEVGPEPQPDSITSPPLLALELPNNNSSALVCRIATKHLLPPPATGPPRSGRFLAAHATTVLLI